MCVRTLVLRSKRVRWGQVMLLRFVVVCLFCLFVLFFVSLPQSGVFGKRKPQLKNCLQQTVPQASLWSIFVINDSCGKKAQPTVAVCAASQVVLGDLRPTIVRLES